MYPFSGAAAYDRAITVFSPEGELYQVKYATKAAERGTLGVGIVYNDGVLLAADKRVTSKLLVSPTLEKLFIIDDHIAILYSGLVGDARVLAEYARDIAEQHKILYDEPIPVERLVKEIAKIKQAYTQYGGTRPFGVSFLIAGYNEHPRLFETQPSGTLLEYKADAIGNRKYDVMELLEKEWRPDLTRDEAIALAIKALRIPLEEGDELTPERLILAYIEKDRQVHVLNPEDIKPYLG
ncbi:MAG: proteasome alpha subunit [Candidatus Diapherotrites archaeon]|nr:proteasome alpha subunit [Candidatus Diapherotrites archaeon]MDN5367061.1 proteasome alpha subunit [Candidatus Diapherotrites archaeon]